jgi:hypothetical protein
MKEVAALGCLPSMALLGGTIQVQAKSAAHSNEKQQEQEAMTKLRQSRIFHYSTEDKKRRKTTT